ncbi:hypothetical protein VCV18_004812 [Metarhizium anisopliae]
MSAGRAATIQAADLARNKAVFQNLHLGTRCHQGPLQPPSESDEAAAALVNLTTSLLKWLPREHRLLTALTWLGAGCTAYCPTGPRHHDRQRLSKRRKTSNQQC